MTRRGDWAVRIGDFVCAITGITVFRVRKLSQRYRAFQCSPTSPADLKIILLPRRPSRQRCSGIEVTSSATGITLESEEFSGRFDPATGSVTAWVQEQPEAFDIFLRVLFSIFLPLHAALLVHACGFVRNGKAFVFAGHSETGKTTTARLLPAGQVLSDELVIVRHYNDGWHAYATPFSGEFSGAIRNQQAPLVGACFLERSGIPTRPVTSRPHCLVHWLEHVFSFCRDSVSQQRMLTLAHELAAGVPAIHADISAARKVERIIHELGQGDLAAEPVSCLANSR